jgi:type VI secretion system protein ImpM
MSQMTSVSLAWFGKVASRGDFVRSTQQGALTQMLDQWLSQGLELVSVDPRWKQRYDQVGPCRFAFLGARSQVALAGHMIPSVDSSGRRFPFVTAGSFDVEAPLPFMSHAPMALSRLWSRLEAIGREVCAAEDATASLNKATQSPRLEIDTSATAYATSFDDFLEMQTVGSLEELLRAAHPRLELRRTLLAIGLLLQPVPASGVSRLDKGLALPLPDDPLYAPFVGAFWMSLVAPFLARGDFELALFVLRRQPEGGSELCIGFAGGSPATLQAIFDVDKRAEAFVEVVAADWADEHADDDYAIKKLSSYLSQPQLSMSQAMRTFKECFLGE